ncbi:hypothetical protein AXG93_2912s1580 [Marchantia polymorpha subsp. ruderalis]|uniref:Uncharacterized protein n=1 Tax=Marchantia polymorpha subsp. ruderalis TaxID=1480154 RepID=A0A176WFZ4_MARPO|nr:hypothetical protein AXG93_2912s1580 [Marchantia polymorpha subsp. ruderalis]
MEEAAEVQLCIDWKKNTAAKTGSGVSYKLSGGLTRANEELILLDVLCHGLSLPCPVNIEASGGREIISRFPGRLLLFFAGRETVNGKRLRIPWMMSLSSTEISDAEYPSEWGDLLYLDMGTRHRIASPQNHLSPSLGLAIHFIKEMSSRNKDSKRRKDSKRTDIND